MVSGTGVHCDDGPTPQRILNSCHPGRHLISPMAGYDSSKQKCWVVILNQVSLVLYSPDSRGQLLDLKPALNPSCIWGFPELWCPIVGFLSSYRSNMIFLQFGNSCLGQVPSGTIKTPKAKARAALAGWWTPRRASRALTNRRLQNLVRS